MCIAISVNFSTVYAQLQVSSLEINVNGAKFYFVCLSSDAVLSLQLQLNFPTFKRLDNLELTRNSLKGPEFNLSVAFLLVLQLLYIHLLFIIFYYIDTSVILENIPLVKFIKTTSGTRVVYFP